jgi:uncharacterized protein with GYD domain
MARYRFMPRYASGGVIGVVTAGDSARRAAIEKMAKELGGHLETFDLAFGEDDVYTTVELPDNKTAAAVALAINSTGHTSVRTVVLMTPEEVDAAAAQTVNYIPPAPDQTRSWVPATSSARCRKPRTESQGPTVCHVSTDARARQAVHPRAR